MKLRFGEIEEVLAIVHAIPVEGRTQFRARLRNLFRAGPGLNLPAGRVGRRANYGPDDMYKMALAAELLQAGLAPEAVVFAVSSFWPAFRWKIAQYRLSARLTREGRPQKGGQFHFLMFEPAALVAARFPRIEEGDPQEVLARMSGADPSASTRLVLISIASLVEKIATALVSAGCNAEQFSEAVDAGDTARLAEPSSEELPEQA